MAKITRKLPEPNTDIDQQTSSSKGEKYMKTPYQLTSRDGVKVVKTIMQIKRPLPRRSSKQVSGKSTKSIRKPKKVKGITLFVHYHGLNEELNHNEPEQDPEKLENPTTTIDDLESQ